MRPSIPILVFALLGLAGRTTCAFQSTPIGPNPIHRPVVTADTISEGFLAPRASTVLYLKAKPKKGAVAKPKKGAVAEGKSKQEWDFSLLLVYMTPWKNPNSIFVYMFALVYGLGKYSESMSAAGQ